MNPNTATVPHMAATSHKLTLCHSCGDDKPPEGGVYLKPERWCCKACWAGVQMKIARRIAGAAWGAGRKAKP